MGEEKRSRWREEVSHSGWRLDRAPTERIRTSIVLDQRFRNAVADAWFGSFFMSHLGPARVAKASKPQSRFLPQLRKVDSVADCFDILLS
jgi:hypothetical protein